MPYTFPEHRLAGSWRASAESLQIDTAAAVFQVRRRTGTCGRRQQPRPLVRDPGLARSPPTPPATYRFWVTPCRRLGGTISRRVTPRVAGSGDAYVVIDQTSSSSSSLLPLRFHMAHNQPGPRGYCRHWHNISGSLHYWASWIPECPAPPKCKSAWVQTPFPEINPNLISAYEAYCT